MQNFILEIPAVATQALNTAEVQLVMTLNTPLARWAPSISELEHNDWLYEHIVDRNGRGLGGLARGYTMSWQPHGC